MFPFQGKKSQSHHIAIADRPLTLPVPSAEKESRKSFDVCSTAGVFPALLGMSKDHITAAVPATRHTHNPWRLRLPGRSCVG